MISKVKFINNARNMYCSKSNHYKLVKNIFNHKYDLIRGKNRSD